MRTHRRTGMYALVAVALLTMIVSIILSIGTEEDSSDTESQITRSSRLLLKQDESGGNNTYIFGEMFLNLDGGIVGLKDLNGNVIDDSLVYNKPKCVTAGNYALVYDETGTGFCLLDQNGIVYRSNAPGVTGFASVNSSGYSLLISEKSGSKGVVTINGPEIAGLINWESKKSGFVLSGHVSKAGDYFDAVVMNTNYADINSSVKRFDNKGNAIQDISFDEKRHLFDITYLSDDSFCAYGQKDLLLIHPGKDNQYLSLEDIYFVISDGANYYVAGKLKKGNHDYVYKLNSEGELKELFVINDIPRQMIDGRKNIIIVNGSEISIYNKNNGKINKTVTFNEPVVRIALDNSGKLIRVVTEDGIYEADN